MAGGDWKEKGFVVTTRVGTPIDPRAVTALPVTKKDAADQMNAILTGASFRTWSSRCVGIS